MVKNLENNHAMWVKIIDDETQQTDDADASDVNASPSSSVTDDFTDTDCYTVFHFDFVHNFDVCQ